MLRLLVISLSQRQGTPLGPTFPIFMSICLPAFLNLLTIKFQETE